MDIPKILAQIKGKVLDATNFELLQSAYELQNSNLDQLKQNNEAISESQQLLKEKSDRIVKENESLKARVAELEAQLSAIDPDKHSSGLSEAAIAILKYCLEKDVTDFYPDQMIGEIGMSRMQIEAAVDELEEKELTLLGSVSPMGNGYNLTDSGKKYALSM